MNFAVEHIGLAAQLPERLMHWYVSTMGGTTVFANGQNPPAFLIQLPGGPLLEIYPASHGMAESSYNRLAGWRHLALKVDSIESARNWLEVRGVVFEEAVKPAGGGGSVLFFKDPEGNLLHLVERPPDSPLAGR